MPIFHFYSSLRLSTTYPKLTLLRIKWPLNYIKIFILLCLPFNAALAGEIFSTGFESGSLDKDKDLQNGFSWGDGTYASVSSNNKKSGKYSLRFKFLAGPDDSDDSWSEQRFNLGGYYPDLWVKYDLYIPPNYYHRTTDGPNNNKGFLWAWAGTYNSTTNGVVTREGPKLGNHFWPTGSVGNTQSTQFASAYINGKYNINTNWQGRDMVHGNSHTAIVENDRGHWMTLVIHYKYATIANNDGVAEVWKTDWHGNTEKLIDIHDGPWYGTQPTNGKPGRGFEAGYLLGWASTGFTEETILYIDNVTFSTSPLNNDSTASYSAAPMPPSIIN